MLQQVVLLGFNHCLFRVQGKWFLATDSSKMLHYSLVVSLTFAHIFLTRLFLTLFGYTGVYPILQVRTLVYSARGRMQIIKY